jgi:tRNA threonylcarbamoyladenosine modification (KEOPS) complex  Pcc1 subunit
MSNAKFDAEAELSILLPSRKEVRSIAAALRPEASHPAGEKANAKIILRGRKLKIMFRARDSPSLRAIMSSYLRMLKATITVCGSLLEMDRRIGKRGQRQHG